VQWGAGAIFIVSAKMQVLVDREGSGGARVVDSEMQNAIVKPGKAAKHCRVKLGARVREWTRLLISRFGPMAASQTRRRVELEIMTAGP